jgi:hypothetical protein
MDKICGWMIFHLKSEIHQVTKSKFPLTLSLILRHCESGDSLILQIDERKNILNDF